MLKTLAAVAALSLAFAAAASAETLTGTSGPYAVVMEPDPALPDHTVYKPADLSAVTGKLPVIAFGNGGCANVGNSFQTLLGEVASHGYLITAPGPIVAQQPRPPQPPPAAAGAAAPRPAGPPPGGMRQSKPGQMITALDWAFAADKRAGGAYAGRLDLTKVAVMGQSCGGLEAIAAGKDPRVTTVVVLNSGVIRGGIPNADGSTRAPSGYLPASEADLPGLHTPTVYLIGGPGDQAYRGAEGDYADLTRIPLFNGNINVGHGGTWREPHGGEMGRVVLAWLGWRLKGETAGGSLFTGKDCGLCADPRWTVKSKNMP